MTKKKKRAQEKNMNVGLTEAIRAKLGVAKKEGVSKKFAIQVALDDLFERDDYVEYLQKKKREKKQSEKN